MQYLRVHNWETWQTYRRDRGQPPWIKLHRSIMRDVKWVSLGCQRRGQLVAMWLLAADNSGQIPADPVLVKKLCFMDDVPDLKYFVINGFLDDDANVTSAWRQHDATESEAEAESETETEAESEKIKPLVTRSAERITSRKNNGKDKVKPIPAKKRFIKPSLKEVAEYCRSRGNNVDPEQWMNHYTSNGWKVGRNGMSDWKAAIRTWEKLNYQPKPEDRPGPRSKPLAD